MRVVVVDPSRTVLKFVSRMLQARDHDVTCFVDGKAALQHIKSDPQIGALITSAQLLTMSGLELCWEARLAAGRRPIYIILMSSNQERGNLVEALDSGADDFIGKPPIPEELYARLRAAGRLASMQNELIRLATTDPLTGLLNRRAFFEHAAECCALARDGSPLSAVMVDIDHFKKINDDHGHDAGDRIIRDVAREAASLKDAVVGRLGGEEFAMLFPGRQLADAATIAQALRIKMKTLKPPAAGDAASISCSFGVSEWRDGDTIDELLRRADVALYAAKAAGRDRVVLSDETLALADYDGAGRPVRAAQRDDDSVAANQAPAADHIPRRLAAG